MLTISALLREPRYRPFWRGLLAALVLTAAWFAFTPRGPTLPIENGDKLQHIVAFGSMATAAALSLRAAWRATFGAALWLLMYGCFIECVQYFLPARSCDWRDVVADCVGIAAGLLLVALLRRWRS